MEVTYSFTSFFLTYFFIFVLFGPYSSLGVDESLQPKKKREVQCADGMYQHGTINCCLCAIGQHLKEDCTASNPQDTQCELCEPGTFNNYPNQNRNCQGCTSCSHHNANLEEETACTRARDATCRCKARHYCISAKDQDCKLCSSCTECGIEGVKVACTSTNDTVCNANLKERTHVWTVVVVVFVVAAAIVIGLCIRRTRKQRRSNQPSLSKPVTSDTEMETMGMPYTDPSRHLPAIAEQLGWTTMSNVALRSGMNPVAVDSCKLNHPHDSQEQTQHLLRMFVQEQGKNAMNTLIQILHNMRQNDNAQKVRTILSQN
ncbi:tumor necrosis factor receptor superfamily member 6 [Vanacampus margaritifer]